LSPFAIVDYCNNAIVFVWMLRQTTGALWTTEQMVENGLTHVSLPLTTTTILTEEGYPSPFSIIDWQQFLF